jgi:uncharacterized damage-inducible protein DinB
MTLPTALAAVVDLQRAHRDLLRVVDSLSPKDWSRGVPYGEWTIKDLVAHCIGDMSPSGPGLIVAGVLTPAFIEETVGAVWDARALNEDMVASRRRFTPEDLRQLLFEAHDARIEATLRIDESHEEVLAFPVPMGPNYNLLVEDWLWYGYHDRAHAADIRRALETNWTPQSFTFIPEIEAKMGALVRSHEGLLRAIYTVADDAWNEPSESNPEWTYHDILAHVASNERRRRSRLLSAVLNGENVAELEGINDIDGWNAERVRERINWSTAKLVDELVEGWHEILVTLSQFQGEHLERNVTLGGGRSMSTGEFLNRMSEHTSTHAAQLVPASRARQGRT